WRTSVAAAAPAVRSRANAAAPIIRRRIRPDANRKLSKTALENSIQPNPFAARVIITAFATILGSRFGAHLTQSAAIFHRGIPEGGWTPRKRRWHHALLVPQHALAA